MSVGWRPHAAAPNYWTEKQHILADELERVRLHGEFTRAEWEKLAREAAVWRRRAAALDGSWTIRAVAPVEPARVQPRWGSAMGVLYPEGLGVRLPAQTPTGGSSALFYAADLHRSALEAGARYAAAGRAELLLAAELDATRTRHRGVQNRWIPRLENELIAVRRQLDEQELEESLRLRWAADRNPGTAGGTHGNPVSRGSSGTAAGPDPVCSRERDP